jgi:hypothetical protein
VPRPWFGGSGPGGGRLLAAMDVTASLDAPCPPAELRRWVDDLERYPAWLSIVPRADREPTAGGGQEAEATPAWAVELRATFGPLARSKRLRMVRTVDDVDHLRFERSELDGKQHSPWVLDAKVEGTATGSRLVMALHYGGSFGGGLIERLLRDEIEASKPRLLSLVSS